MTNDDQAKLLRIFLSHLGRMSTGTRELVVMSIHLREYAAAERLFLKGLVLPVPVPVGSKPPAQSEMEFD